MVEARAIANLYGVKARGNQVNIPTPGHATGDQGTSITCDPGYPDGFMVHSFNGGDELAIKREILARLGLEPEGPKKKPKEKPAPVWEAITPVPETAPKLARGFVERHAPKNHTLRAGWVYWDRRGRMLGAMARYDGPINGGDKPKKEFRPFAYCRKGDLTEWRSLSFGKSLYGLNHLAMRPEAPVLVVEGERTADAAAKLFPDLVVVTSPYGAGAAARADWLPLKGREVTLWPDHDDAGRDYTTAVAAMLSLQGVKARLVEVPESFPGGWDLADEPPAGADLQALLQRTVEPPKPDPILVQPPAFSDDLMALMLTQRHVDELRYVPGWSKWMRWQGGRWNKDSILHVFDQSRIVCREVAAHAEMQGKSGKVLASSRTVASVEILSRSDKRLVTTIEQWDGEPTLELLNTPAGTVDLTTSEMRPHRQTDYITMTTAVSPRPMDIPLWTAFLHRVMGGDAELIQYIQRVLGYCLTGLTYEHALWFLYGTGANGKTVFVNTISGILNEYQKTAPIETFTATKVDRHPTEIARLMGARLVTATETEEGRRWAESRIKSLTGGDTQTARFMRQDDFEFTPRFKLMIAGNHKPGLRSVDEAIRRRFNLIPFTVTIPETERDPDLAEKLKAEWPGILHWMIDGCLEWRERGLRPPEAVRLATEAYLAAEDATLAWIDECCVRGGDWTSKSALYASWKAWAERMGEFVGSSKRFGQIMESHGFEPVRRSEGLGYRSIELKLPEVPPPHTEVDR